MTVAALGFMARPTPQLQVGTLAHREDRAVAAVAPEPEAQVAPLDRPAAPQRGAPIQHPARAPVLRPPSAMDGGQHSGCATVRCCNIHTHIAAQVGVTERTKHWAGTGTPPLGARDWARTCAGVKATRRSDCGWATSSHQSISTTRAAPHHLNQAFSPRGTYLQWHAAAVGRARGVIHRGGPRGSRLPRKIPNLLQEGWALLSA